MVNLSSGITGSNPFHNTPQDKFISANKNSRLATKEVSRYFCCLKINPGSSNRIKVKIGALRFVRTKIVRKQQISNFPEPHRVLRTGHRESRTQLWIAVGRLG